MNEPHRFGYFRDPVCTVAAWLYLTNRFVFKPYGIGGDFAHHYVNDLLCLPLFLPIILWAQRMIGLRRHDGPPRLWEVLQHWLVFSLIFEVVVPRFPDRFRSTADPLDGAAYLVGGLAGLALWTKTARVATAHAARAVAADGASWETKEARASSVTG
jgi:hypothetical protein